MIWTKILLNPLLLAQHIKCKFFLYTKKGRGLNDLQNAKGCDNKRSPEKDSKENNSLFSKA